VTKNPGCIIGVNVTVKICSS